MWRETLGESADAALAEMSTTQDNQNAFARAARKLLAALDLAEAEVDSEPDDSTEDGEDGGEQSGQQDNSDDGEGQSQSESESMLGAQPRKWKAKLPTTTDRNPTRKRGGRGRRPPWWPAAAP